MSTTLLAELTAAAPEDARVQRLLGDVLSLARRHLGLEVAFLSRVHDGRRHFDAVDTVAGFAPVQVGASDPVAETYCGRVLSGQIPQLIVDAHTEPGVADLDATWDLPVGTHLSVPVTVAGRVYGTLCCFSRTVTDPTEADLATLQMFADVVGAHLQPLVHRSRAVAEARDRFTDLLDDGWPRMALQPIVELAGGTVCGYEALARFPARDGWGPQDWFDAAAAVGMGQVLEAAAVHRALHLLPRLEPEVTLAINVSAAALLTSDAIAAMFSGPQADRLVLEITEHSALPNPGLLTGALATVRAAGVRVAVDDAGSGFSGLERILALEPEVLKLDRSLVGGIAGHRGRQALCEAMARFAVETGATVVAEGVETGADLAALRRAGVTHAQGYLFGRPEVWVEGPGQ